MNYSILYIAALALISSSCETHSTRKQGRTDIVVKSDTAPLQKEPANPYAPIDISPLDMSYYPVNFPVLKMSKEENGLPVARVIYGRPHRQGRKIFGHLLKYGEPWRLGANEATEIEFFRNVTIQNRKINKGRYILYCIPQPDKWTIVFNSNLFTWGLKIDTTKDLFRFDIPVQHAPASVEYFTMVFEPAATGADLLMTWDDIITRLPISFK